MGQIQITLQNFKTESTVESQSQKEDWNLRLNQAKNKQQQKPNILYGS